MPTRILRPGLTTSDRWNALGWVEQSLYVRLITVVDDSGRFDGRPQIVHAHCFALRSDVSVEDVQRMLAELGNRGLLIAYVVGGKPFLQITNWQERMRTASKYPSPPQVADSQHADICQQSADICQQSADNCQPPTPNRLIAYRLSPKSGDTAVASSPRAAFVKPTLDEVKAYAAELQLDDLEAQAFFDYYSSNGWKVGRSAMKDWRAALRNWQRRAQSSPRQSAQQAQAQPQTAWAIKAVLEAHEREMAEFKKKHAYEDAHGLHISDPTKVDAWRALVARKKELNAKLARL